MPWVRLDDAILDNEKIAAVGPLGFALHVAAIVYCGRNLTDGWLPFGHARRLLATKWTEDAGENKPPFVWEIATTCGMGGNDGDEAIEQTIGMLCDVGLWDHVAHGYVIHDYLDYNPSRETVLAERAEKKAAKVAAGKASAAARRAKDGTAQPVKPEQRTEQAPEQEPEQSAEHHTEQSAEQSSNPVPNPVPQLTPVISKEITPPLEEREAAKRSKDRDRVLGWLKEHRHPARPGVVTRWTVSQGWSAATIIAALERAVQEYGPRDPMAYIVASSDQKPHLLSRVKVEQNEAEHNAVRAAENHPREAMV